MAGNESFFSRLQARYYEELKWGRPKNNDVLRHQLPLGIFRNAIAIRQQFPNEMYRLDEPEMTTDGDKVKLADIPPEKLDEYWQVHEKKLAEGSINNITVHLHDPQAQIKTLGGFRKYLHSVDSYLKARRFLGRASAHPIDRVGMKKLWDIFDALKKEGFK